jgi:hypothetical protein
MEYQPMIAPHFDRHLRYSPKDPVAGFREDWPARMVANCPKGGRARDGYIAALQFLTAESCPPAVMRVADIAKLQDQIRGILSSLT